MPAAAHPDPFEAWQWQRYFDDFEMNEPWRASREAEDTDAQYDMEAAEGGEAGGEGGLRAGAPAFRPPCEWTRRALRELSARQRPRKQRQGHGHLVRSWLHARSRGRGRRQPRVGERLLLALACAAAALCGRGVRRATDFDRAGEGERDNGLQSMIGFGNGFAGTIEMAPFEADCEDQGFGIGAFFHCGEKDGIVTVSHMKKGQFESHEGHGLQDWIAIARIAAKIAAKSRVVPCSSDCSGSGSGSNSDSSCGCSSGSGGGFANLLARRIARIAARIAAGIAVADCALGDLLDTVEDPGIGSADMSSDSRQCNYFKKEKASADSGYGEEGEEDAKAIIVTGQGFGVYSANSYSGKVRVVSVNNDDQQNNHFEEESMVGPVLPGLSGYVCVDKAEDFGGLVYSGRSEFIGHEINFESGGERRRKYAHEFIELERPLEGTDFMTNFVGKLNVRMGMDMGSMLMRMLVALIELLLAALSALLGFTAGVIGIMAYLAPRFLGLAVFGIAVIAILGPVPQQGEKNIYRYIQWNTLHPREKWRMREEWKKQGARRAEQRDLPGHRPELPSARQR